MRADSTFEIGRRLRELRERCEMSQAELAQTSGLGVGLISRYEREDVSPSWYQLERLLEGMGQEPCALFSDLCKLEGGGPKGEPFTVKWFDRPPSSPDGYDNPDETLTMHYGPINRKLRMLPVDGRYTFMRAMADWMVPDWVPGDIVVCDCHLQPAPRRIIAGFHDGQGMVRRLVTHKKRKLLIASNRNYPPIEFNPKKWVHMGCIIHAFRDLTHDYVAGTFGDWADKHLNDHK